MNIADTKGESQAMLNSMLRNGMVSNSPYNIATLEAVVAILSLTEWKAVTGDEWEDIPHNRIVKLEDGGIHALTRTGSNGSVAIIGSHFYFDQPKVVAYLELDIDRLPE